MLKRYLTMLVLVMTLPAVAAPQLSDADRERLEDGTSDRDGLLDQQDGLYVLLRNASTWVGDDFGGDAGAAVAPPPDYAFLKDKPSQARGNVYLLEGWLAGADRWPTKDNHDRDKLHTTLDPTLGDQVSRWTIITEKGNADATIIVLFHDPTAKIKSPADESKVRVAARFYKLWTIQSAEGKPFTYPVFVAGAFETLEQPQGTATTGGTSRTSGVLIAIIAVVGIFFALRILMRKLATGSGGGTMVQDRLNEIRREREARGGDDEVEEDTADLPDDPIAALDVLRQKHETNGQ